jgi:hypothetical protein
MTKRRTERRFLPTATGGLEARAGEGDQPVQLVGHASVFNQWSTISSWFGELWDERVAPGAFKKTLKEADVRALWNHDENVILGRNKAGTLALREDETGLLATIMPPDNEWGRPIIDAVRRGDVSGMSIAFEVVQEDWEYPDRKKDPEGRAKRTIKEVKLYDVSPVTFPAFPQTDIAARSETVIGRNDGELMRAFRALQLAQMGMPIGDQDRAALRATVDVIQRYAENGEPGAPANAGVSNHSPETEPEPKGHHSVELLRRELELMELQHRTTGR